MLKELFGSRPKYATVRARVPSETTEPGKGEEKDVWRKCDNCDELVYKKELEKNLYVCPLCGYHFRIGARERIAHLVDPGSFNSYFEELVTCNPLGFPNYPEKLKRDQEKTGLTEAALVGKAAIDQMPVVFGVVDFGFIGGSMGSVVGEKITRAFELAMEENLPVVLVSAGGGGARMHEGILSLMQMSKTSQAVGRFQDSGKLYLSILTDPTFGGIYASFASLADIILAEPGALIGFAGPRVVKETIRQNLPPGFQKAEFALEHGMIDCIVERKDLRSTTAAILRLHQH